MMIGCNFQVERLVREAEKKAIIPTQRKKVKKKQIDPVVEKQMKETEKNGNFGWKTVL